MSGFGTDPLGLAPFGSPVVALPRGRVYATVLPTLGVATLAASPAGTAKLAASPQAFAKLSPSAGSSTLQND